MKDGLEPLQNGEVEQRDFDEKAQYPNGDQNAFDPLQNISDINRLGECIGGEGAVLRLFNPQNEQAEQYDDAKDHAACERTQQKGPLPAFWLPDEWQEGHHHDEFLKRSGLIASDEHRR